MHAAYLSMHIHRILTFKVACCICIEIAMHYLGDCTLIGCDLCENAMAALFLLANYQDKLIIRRLTDRN